MISIQCRNRIEKALTGNSEGFLRSKPHPKSSNETPISGQVALRTAAAPFEHSSQGLLASDRSTGAICRSATGRREVCQKRMISLQCRDRIEKALTGNSEGFLRSTTPRPGLNQRQAGGRPWASRAAARPRRSRPGATGCQSRSPRPSAR